jgi:putative ABC transport system permease protein
MTARSSKARTVAMVMCSVSGTGLVAGLIAVPVGSTLPRYVLPRMAAAAGTDLPARFLNVYHGWELTALALAGAVIAMAGALLPASWAARTRTASALRAEWGTASRTSNVNSSARQGREPDQRMLPPQLPHLARR